MHWREQIIVGYADVDMAGMWTYDSLLPGLLSLLLVVSYHGNQSYKSVLAYPVLRQSSLQLLRLAIRCFG